MLQARRRIKFRVSEAEGEFFEEMARGGVRGMMPGKKGVGAERFKTIGDDGTGGFFREALAPKFRAQMKAQLENIFFRLIRTQASAADVLAVCEQKNRPILNAILAHPGDLFFEPFAHLLI